jgi:uncharacterized membrane protein
MSSPSIKSLRNAFLAGIIVLAPLAVTVMVFNWLISAVGGAFPMPPSLKNLPFFGYFEVVWNAGVTAVVIALVTALGYLSRYVATRFFFAHTERLMQRVPLISAVYNTVKQIVETVSSQRRAVFEKVVMVPFPRSGSFAIGFLTNRSTGEIQARAAEEICNVFIPTTPNPTSGFLVMFPRREIVEMQMSVGDAMKLIISGGALVPPWPPRPASAESSAALPAR